MLQMENINKIEYLKHVIEELKTYSISLEKESQKLDLLISNYKLKKEQEQKEESLVLKSYASPETELSIELMKLEMDLEIYILFLELFHLTEDWNLNVNLEKFDMIENKLEKIVLTFGSMDLQKEIYKRFQNLLLKKIIKDYQEEKEEYVSYYQDLKKFPYLIESIQSYGASSLLSLPEHLENYTIETILEEYLTSPKQELISIEEKETKVEINKDKGTIYTSFWKKIKQAYCSIDSYAYLGKARVEVIKKIGYEKAKSKDFSGQDLRGIDLSTVDFTDVYIARCNLRNTGAHINPQTIVAQSLHHTNLEGLDLSEQDFTGCCIEGCNLKGTNAHIDPQKVLARSLQETNLEGLDLFDADLSGVNVSHANLKNTRAYIIPTEVVAEKHDLRICLEGCFVNRTKDDWYLWYLYTGYNKVYDNPQKLLERYGNKKDEIIKVIGIEKAVYHNFANADLSNIDLSDIDFSNLIIFGANLKGTNSFINLNKISMEGLGYRKKKGNLSSCRVILSDNPVINEEFDLTNAIILDRDETQVRKLMKK